MRNFKKYFTIIMLVMIGVISSQKLYSQTEDEKRAMWIFNIAPGITWENEANISKFTIGVFSSQKAFDELEKLAAMRTIKGKPVEIIKYTNYADVEPNHILYVTKNENAYLAFVYQKLNGKNVLIISDRSKQPEYSVINLNKADASKPFDINTRLAGKQNLKFSTTILRLGGSREDIRIMQIQTNKRLIAEQKMLEQKKLEIEEKEKLLKEQEDKIKSQRDSIAGKEYLLSAKENEVKEQNLKLDSMSSEVMMRKEELLKNLAILEIQTENINKQKEFVKKLNEEIELKSKDLKEQEERLRKNKEVLGESQATVASQKTYLFIFAGIGIVVIFMLILIVVSYINKQKVNRQLSEQYVAINSQKDEIQNQAKQLESVNSELEKLSLVASETDNAVSILDVNGNFEWVNAGFTRMYGYTLQLLRNELDENIISASGNPDVKRVIEEILETKQTGYYQNLNKTRRGEDIWAQTTITPILDDNNEVVKLITIDTDITVAKKAEIEIIKQKEFIEIQNEAITSSINYAKNIQQAILPLGDDLEKYFDSFVIFKPRDIVSGDFYWYAHLPATDDFSEKIFVAAVDCTGHGVPGAFMSMIGSRLLSEIVLEQKIVSPKDILERLDEKVKLALRQETTDNNDGMDMTLCMIEKEDNTFHITYSGAKCDLYYYSKKDDDITILSSARRSIGGTIQKRGNIEFDNKDFFVYNDDSIWLSTDGIIDQNNAERKRFGTPRYIETLKEAKDLSLAEQKNLIEKRLAEYQGEEEQRDDITIWGIKFSDLKWS
ncbi:MAG: YfiR/HmsC family protein [Bacteroidales bacterium]|nr:YfiR/HmsC family protein [Bacteroidales bacterium]